MIESSSDSSRRREKPERGRREEPRRMRRENANIDRLVSLMDGKTHKT